MKTILLVLSLQVLFSCYKPSIDPTHSTSKVGNDPQVRGQEKTIPKSIVDTCIIDDPSMYAQDFVKSLQESKQYQHLMLYNGLLILNQEDTISFPDTPTLGNRYTMHGRKDELEMSLSVSRINYTSVKYHLEIRDENHDAVRSHGVADIGSFFFLGSESDTDDDTSLSYFSTEYAHLNDSCYIYIRMGNLEDSQDRPLLAKVIKNCNEEIVDIKLEESPTLRQE